MVGLKPTNRYEIARERSRHTSQFLATIFSHCMMAIFIDTFNSGGRVQVCDSLRTNLTSISKNFWNPSFNFLWRMARSKYHFFSLISRPMVSIIVSLLWAMLVICWMVNPPLMFGLLLMKCAITLWNAWKTVTYILSQHLRKPLMFQATNIIFHILIQKQIFHFIIWFKT